MKANTKRIKRLVTAFITGLIGESTKGGGIKASSTASVFTRTLAKIR